MTDPTEGPTDEPTDGSPEQEHVRALLGDVAADDLADPPAVPDDVRLRLEETLVGLRTPPAGADVVPLRQPVHRRWRPALATAAVVVLVAGGGFAVASGAGVLGADDDAASESAGSTAADETTEEDVPTPETLSAPAPSASASAPAPGSPGSDAGGSASRSPELARVVVPTVSAADLDADVVALLGRGVLQTPDTASSRLAQQRDVRRAGCQDPAADDATRQVVVFEGEPAVLLIGQPSPTRADAGVPVTVVTCDTGELIQETLVAPDAAER